MWESTSSVRWLVCLFCLLHYRPASGLDQLSNEYFVAKSSLITKLTNNSSIMKEILPVVNDSTPVLVKLGVTLHQISEVNEINQAIRLTAWLRVFWDNPFLQWNPDNYQGIKAVHLDSDHLWIPDLAIVNQASLEEEVDILYKRMSTKLILHSNGSIKWLAPISLLTQCRIDVSHFPFDEQECKVVFGSWTYPLNDINLTYKVPEIDLDQFIQNGEWEISSAFLKYNVEYYNTTGENHTDVTFHLRIKRRPLYFIVNLIVPCSLIALLSFISFVLPSNHGERVSLVITVLLANSVYMLIVSSSLPQTSDTVPVIAVYFVAIIIEIALCLFATCLTSKLYEKSSEMPAWFNKLVNHWLARCICNKNAAKYAEKYANEEKRSGPLEVLKNDSYHLTTQDKRIEVNGMNGIEAIQQDLELVEASFTGFNGKEESGHTHAEAQRNESQALTELRVLADEVRSKNAQDLLAKKWRRTARILDRFFLIVFVLIYVILTTYLLTSMR